MCIFKWHFRCRSFSYCLNSLILIPDYQGLRVPITVFPFVFQLFQLRHQFNHYFSWGNLLEWAAFILAIIYVADEFNVSVVNK